jgi:hypothetical protein
MTDQELLTSASCENAELVFDPSRKDKHWGKRKLKRDP